MTIRQHLIRIIISLLGGAGNKEPTGRAVSPKEVHDLMATLVVTQERHPKWGFRTICRLAAWMSRNTKQLGQDGFTEIAQIGTVIFGRTINILDDYSDDDFPDDVADDKRTALIIEGMIKMAGQGNDAEELHMGGPDWATRVTEFLVH